MVEALLYYNTEMDLQVKPLQSFIFFIKLRKTKGIQEMNVNK